MEEIKEINKKRTFLKSGMIALAIFIIYELIIYIFAQKLNLFAIVLFYLPIMPFMAFFTLFDLNYYLMWFLILIAYFIIGGFIGIFISKILNKR